MGSASTGMLLLPLLFFVTSATATADSMEDEAMIMLSSRGNLKVMVGDTVLLPCKVKNLGRNARIWKQLPSNILFSGNIAVSKDSKVTLLNDSLHIEKITPDYGGDYICQISNHPNVNVLHTIQVQVPASLSPDPPAGKVIFRKGEPAVIFCNPTGIPKPHITWTYGDEHVQGTALPRGVRQVQGSQLQFSSVDIHHSGIYKCMAENDVAEPASATFNVQVHYAPELLIKPEWAHGDEGATVDFACTCRSSPTSQIYWIRGNHKDGQKLENLEDDRIQMKLKQSSPDVLGQSLRIQRLSREDLGPYTCVAKNIVGQTWKTVEISGLSETVQVRGNISGEGSFLLMWRAKSYSPIIEYQLKIRKHKSGDQWTDVVIPAVVHEGQSFIYSQSYNVTGLDPSARYEVVIQAHNDFGWNRPSETFFFGKEPPPTESFFEENTVPSLLPLYDAELDVTDPTYLEHSTASSRIWTDSPTITCLTAIFLIYLHLLTR